MPKNSVRRAYDRPVALSVVSEPRSLHPLVCYSHLRWDFVYQRPQHLMTRFARHRRVYFVEEPMRGDGPARVEITKQSCGVHVAVPLLPHVLAAEDVDTTLQRLMDTLIQREGLASHVAWYYTPMAMAWTRHLRPHTIVYDCMDELSLFRGAPLAMIEREQELLQRAHVVFTGGASLYEAKRDRHANVHCCPSSIDLAHFLPARAMHDDPADQAAIPHVRLGFAGVIDERMDTALLDAIAAARPDWHLVLVGPIVKIDPAHLPQRANIHYLGGKSYAELPAYMAGWDVALLPFAMNDSTRFISPTKTPEYLAAGRPVVSTPIRDVARPYGEAALAQIAETPHQFCAAIERVLHAPADERKRWLTRVDGFLSTMSWDRAYTRMSALLAHASISQQETSVPTRAPAITPPVPPSAPQHVATHGDYDAALSA